MNVRKLWPLVAALVACGPAAEPNATPRASVAALEPEQDCAACHMGSGAGNQDVDDHLFGNAIAARIDHEDWATYGHGATAPYAQSGNPPADLARNGDVAVVGCLYCHTPSEPHGIASNPYLLANVTGPDGKLGVCLACHAPGSPGHDPDGAGAEFASKNALTKISAAHYGPRHGVMGGANGGQYCWDCHDPHGDFAYASGRALAFMVQERPTRDHAGAAGWGVPTALADAVDFNLASGSIPMAFDEGDYVGLRGICQVCHTTTAYYRRGQLEYGHFPSGRCTICHPHEQRPYDAFLAGAAPDVTPPTAAISSPAAGAFVRGVVPVTASVLDDMSGVQRAELWYGATAPTTLASTVMPSGGVAQLSLATSAISGGILLEVRAYDLAGNVGVSPRVAITVDNVPPAVAITAPVDGAMAKGTITVAAFASDAHLARVDFYLDGALAATDATAPYSFAWNTKLAAAGIHTLTAVASDRAGDATTSAPVSVRVR